MSTIPRHHYLAGPMSGVQDHNFPLFNRVARELRRIGHEVFNPAENKDGGERQSRAYYMRLDLPALLQSEAIVLLPGWQRSRGASLEAWMAADLGMPMYVVAEVNGTVMLERVDPPKLKTLPFE